MSDAAFDPLILAPAPARPVQALAVAPSFSVVIPAYQSAATIGRAVASALEQEHPPAEVLVIDDGSSDELEAALAPFAGRLALLRRPHGGAAAARNAGLEAARGEFIALLDADDAYRPQRLAALARLARLRPDLDLLCTDMRFLVDGRAAGTFFERNAFVVDDQRRAILRSCFVGGAPAVRASRLRAAGGFDTALATAEDWDAWLRLILGGASAGLVQLPLYDYTLRPGSLTAGRVESLWDRVRMLERARRHPGLRAEERAVLRSSLRVHRARAARAELERARSGPSARRRLLSLALGTAAGGAQLRLRLGAAVAALAPLRLPRGSASGQSARASRRP